MFTWNADIFFCCCCCISLCKKDLLQLLTFPFCTSSSWIEFINKTNVSISCLSLLHVYIQNICELKQVSVWLLSPVSAICIFSICRICLCSSSRWASKTIWKSTDYRCYSDCNVCCDLRCKIPFIFHAIEMTLEKSISNWCKIHRNANSNNLSYDFDCVINIVNALISLL